jgi:hypothetical protein
MKLGIPINDTNADINVTIAAIGKTMMNITNITQDVYHTLIYGLNY